AYEPDGSLRSRSLPGAVLHDPAAAASRAVSIARDGRVRAADGTWLSIATDTLCIHGDTPGAAQIARAVRTALVAAGIEVRA
ncbi:MAG: LamB/YcsF family protein, partial [Chloroflexi bacterium]|nr:LamB/YcsF family protein [Chloroflexota bacterium]